MGDKLAFDNWKTVKRILIINVKITEKCKATCIYSRSNLTDKLKTRKITILPFVIHPP